jgi:hypothetical protein
MIMLVNRSEYPRNILNRPEANSNTIDSLKHPVATVSTKKKLKHRETVHTENPEKRSHHTQRTVELQGTPGTPRNYKESLKNKENTLETPETH